MIVKIYRYRVDPGKTGRFLEIQRKADELYRRHLEFEVRHLRSLDDPWEWMEIQCFASQKEFEQASNLADCEPRVAELFGEFLETLDPEDETIDELTFEEFSMRA